MSGLRGGHRVAAAAAALVLAAGCAHVNEEQLAAEMDVLRAEMQASDEAVEDRVNGRVDQLESDTDARLNSLEGELESLRGEFQVTVERLESAIRFNAPVHFAFDDDTVRSEDEAVLAHFAQVVSAYYDQATITVEGFTDPSGSAEYNLQLGERRANSVRDFLESAGIPAERMRVVSYGEASERQISPTDQGPGSAGWQNRRVSMVIDFVGEAEGEPIV